MLNKQAKITKSDLPEGWTQEAADFINKCMLRRPANRLGHIGGTAELKSHPWFDSFDWEALACRQMRSPFCPDITLDNFDDNHVNNSDWKDEQSVATIARQLNDPEIQELFKGYYFNKNSTIEEKETTAAQLPTSQFQTIQTSMGNQKDVNFIQAIAKGTVGETIEAG